MHEMNDPFRVGLVATSIEVERCVNNNTGILYSQVKMYFLLQFNIFFRVSMMKDNITRDCSTCITRSYMVC